MTITKLLVMLIIVGGLGWLFVKLVLALIGALNRVGRK